MGCCNSKQATAPPQTTANGVGANTNTVIANGVKTKHASQNNSQVERELSNAHVDRALRENSRLRKLWNEEEAVVHGTRTTSRNSEHNDKDGHNDKENAEVRTQIAPLPSLLTIPFFENLEHENLKKLRNIFERIVYQKGEHILTHGRASHAPKIPGDDNSPNTENHSCLHVIVSGVVNIFVENETDGGNNAVQERVPDYQLTKGEHFLSTMLSKDSLSPISATAAEEVTLFFIPSVLYDQTLANHPSLSVCLSIIDESSSSSPISTSLRSLPLFADMSEMKLHLLGTLFEAKAIPAGTVICSQGEQADGLYHIVQGTVEVTAHAQNSPSFAYLDTLRKGDIFGEISLIDQTCRTATVTATQDCIVIFLSRRRFVRFLKLAPEVRSLPLFTSLLRQRTGNTLKSIPLFSFLVRKSIGPLSSYDEERLTLLGQLFHFVNVEETDVIMREGEETNALYLIVRGKFALSARNDSGEDVRLAELQDNDFFGESTLVYATRCLHTVTALSAGLCLKLEGNQFETLCKISPELEKTMKDSVCTRTALRLKHIPFFQSLKENKPWSKLDLLAGLFNMKEMNAGEVVFREGDEAENFYIVVFGKVTSTVTSSTGEAILLSTLCANQHFGEIALLKKCKRTATITCISDCLFLSLSASRFHTFLTIAPELSSPFSSLLSTRTANTLRTLPLFACVMENKPWAKLEMIAEMFCYEQREKDEFVYQRGEECNKGYVLVHGRVTALGYNERVQTTKSTEESKEQVDSEELPSRSQRNAQCTFALSSLLQHAQYQENVIANERLILLSITRSSWLQLLTVAPEIRAYLEKKGGDEWNILHRNSTLISADSIIVEIPENAASIESPTSVVIEPTETQ